MSWWNWRGAVILVNKKLKLLSCLLFPWSSLGGSIAADLNSYVFFSLLLHDWACLCKCVCVRVHARVCFETHIWYSVQGNHTCPLTLNSITQFGVEEITTGTCYWESIGMHCRGVGGWFHFIGCIVRVDDPAGARRRAESGQMWMRCSWGLKMN